MENSIFTAVPEDQGTPNANASPENRVDRDVAENLGAREESITEISANARSSHVKHRGSATGHDVLPDEALPADSALDFCDEDEKKSRIHDNARAPKIWFLLSFIFPPLGWIGFLQARHSPRDTPRGLWAHRACAMGSLLAFVYTFLAASLVGHYGQLRDTSAVRAGCGFGGPCPLFGEGAYNLP